MEPISAHSILDVVSTGDRKRLVERPRGLSAAALAVANREVRSAYSPIVIAGVMRLIDFGLISLSGVALSLYWTAAVGDAWRCLFLTFGIAAAAVVIFQFLEIYHVLQFRILRLSRMTLGLFIAVLLAMGGCHFIGLTDATLQSWFAAFFCTGIVALISERLVLRAVLRKWGKEGRLDRRTIIVGADKNGERLITALRAQEGSNVEILGVFDDRGDGRAQEICAGVSKLIVSSPALPAGRKLTAGAGKSTMKQKSKSASSSTFTISKIGRCCLIYTSFGERLWLC